MINFSSGGELKKIIFIAHQDMPPYEYAFFPMVQERMLKLPTSKFNKIYSLGNLGVYEFNLKIEKVEIFSDFTYLLSGGYSFRSMYPSILFDILIKLDKFLTLIGKNLFSARMFIVLKKE